MTKKLILLLLVPILFIACAKTESETPLTVVTSVVEKEVALETFNSIDSGKTYTVTDEDSDNPTVEASNVLLSLGEKYFTLGKIITAKDQKGTILELIKCKTVKDEIFWFKTDFVVIEGSLAIVNNDETIIYSEADKLKPTGFLLSKMTIVAVYPDSERGFRKVTTWDEEQNKKRSNVYIKAGDLSTQENDVQSIRTYFLATKNNNEVIKETLYKTALEYSDSIFYDFIEAEYNKEFNGSDEEVEAPKSEEIEFAAIINDNDVNVRNIPVLNGSNIVAKLNTGNNVKVIAQTVDSFTIGDFTDKWYQISEPKGWVFGTLLDP